jgi:hypothetical protein
MRQCRLTTAIVSHRNFAERVQIAKDLLAGSHAAAMKKGPANIAGPYAVLRSADQ